MNEDDFKWVTNEKKIVLLINSSMKIFVLKPLGFRKLSYFSEMLNDALMHREGFTRNASPNI